MENIRPLGNRVLVEPTPLENKTESGLILSDNPTGKPIRGTVLAIGNECSIINAGDKVLYPANSGTEVGGYLILNENNILAII